MRRPAFAVVFCACLAMSAMGQDAKSEAQVLHEIVHAATMKAIDETGGDVLDSEKTPAERLATRKARVEELDKQIAKLKAAADAAPEGIEKSKSAVEMLMMVQDKTRLQMQMTEIEAGRDRVHRMRSVEFTAWMAGMPAADARSYNAFLNGIAKTPRLYLTYSPDKKAQFLRSWMVAKALDEAGIRDEHVRLFYGLDAIEKQRSLK